MPPQISVPLYQTLHNEVKKARTKNLPFNFTHYALVSKVLAPPNGAANNGMMAGAGGKMYTNAEEEVFEPECDFILDMKPLTADEEPRMVTLSQDDFVEKKRIMVFKADKLEKIVGIVKNAFPIS